MIALQLFLCTSYFFNLNKSLNWSISGEVESKTACDSRGINGIIINFMVNPPKAWRFLSEMEPELHPGFISQFNEV